MPSVQACISKCSGYPAYDTGWIILNLQIQRHTSKQKQADDKALQQAKELQLDALQKSYEHVSMMETAGQSKGGVEVETKLNAVKEIGLKARERTILKLRRVMEQVHKQVGMEAELGTVKGKIRMESTSMNEYILTTNNEGETRLCQSRKGRESSLLGYLCLHEFWLMIVLYILGGKSDALPPDESKMEFEDQGLWIITSPFIRHSLDKS
ncbi:hypothetical protein BKA83DRAFT_4129082 [Pisolithus microcarpus]|nr:hypothetical protein BKA83DRAFT_4129082 [Pisolithus microcarpus]